MVVEVCRTATEFVSEKKIASIPPSSTIHSITDNQVALNNAQKYMVQRYQDVMNLLIKSNLS